MLRTDFSRMDCSIARTHNLLGETWTPLILRDVLVGIARFEELLTDLGISRKVLTERLAMLVEQGILDRQQYADRPPRFEYVLTTKGRELCAVLLAMARWGDDWLAGDAGAPVTFVHTGCGQATEFVVCCGSCGEPVGADEIQFLGRSES